MFFGQKRNPISKWRKEILLIKGLDCCPISPTIVMKKTWKDNLDINKWHKRTGHIGEQHLKLRSINETIRGWI